MLVEYTVHTGGAHFITTHLLASPLQSFLFKAVDFSLAFLLSSTSTYRISQSQPYRAWGRSGGTEGCPPCFSTCIGNAFSSLCLPPLLGSPPTFPIYPSAFWVLVSGGSFKSTAKMESLNQLRLLAVEGHGKRYVFCANDS